eukprot:6933579-Prymnesium_polylepis.1
MPVDGERSAPTQLSAGSRSRTSSAGRKRSASSPSTPFSSALRLIASSVASCDGSVATISLPHCECDTPRSLQKAYSCLRPSTHVLPFRLPRS